MSDFWQGVLALPLILMAIATAAAWILGGWLIAEQWWERRSAHKSTISPAGPISVQRSVITSTVLASPHVRTIRLGWGCGLVWFRGLNRVDEERYRRLRVAVGDIRREDESPA